MKKKDANRIKLFLQKWKDNHPAEYADFLETVYSAMNSGDTTLFLRNIFLLENAMPKDVFGKFDWIVDKIVYSKDEREKIKTGKIDPNTPLGRRGVIDMFFIAAYTLKYKDKVAASLAESKPTQLWCMYYWLFFEDGANKLTTMLTKNYYPEKHSWWMRPMIKMAVRCMVKISVQSLMSSKASWNKTLKNEPDKDIQEEITSVLAVTKGTGQGKTIKDEDLENMLIGNKERLMSEIEYFVVNREANSHLGYVFYFLEEAQCIEKKKYKYTTFHRAIIRQFPDAGILGVDSAQELYGKLPPPKDASTRLLNEYDRMKKKMFVKFIEAKQ